MITYAGKSRVTGVSLRGRQTVAYHYDVVGTYEEVCRQAGAAESVSPLYNCSICGAVEFSGGGSHMLAHPQESLEEVCYYR